MVLSKMNIKKEIIINLLINIIDENRDMLDSSVGEVLEH